MPYARQVRYAGKHGRTCQLRFLDAPSPDQAVLICLHHAAVLRVSKTNTLSLPISDSETKCLAAAMEVTNTIRQIGYLDLANVSFLFHHSRLRHESFPSLRRYFAYGSNR